MITVISNVPPAIHLSMLIKLITLNALKSFRVEIMPDTERLAKFFKVFADFVYPFAMSIMIGINNKLIDVEFKRFTFVVYREVARFFFSDEGLALVPVRTENHPDYEIDYSDCRIYEKREYRYPLGSKAKVERYIIKKILENL